MKEFSRYLRLEDMPEYHQDNVTDVIKASKGALSLDYVLEFIDPVSEDGINIYCFKRVDNNSLSDEQWKEIEDSLHWADDNQPGTSCNIYFDHVWVFEPWFC
ncbi:MAG: hypothetical protein ACTSQE_16605 [Candidatus Heimdallarchaeaceae archaeon]